MKKVALITGASSGIGKELAKIHAEKDGDLIIVARREDKLVALKNELENKHGIQVMTVVKDLSKQGAATELYETVKASGVEVEYLINNAGFGGHGKFHERTWQNDLDMINLNMVALTELSKKFLPEFVNRNSGRILNVSSTASFMPGPLQAVYFATKSYVTFLGNALAEELSDTNVTVTTLMPGATATEFGQVSGMDKTDLFKNSVSARSVAEDGYYGMMAGKMDVISGLTFSQKLMVGMVPLTPKKMLLSQVRQMQEVH